MFVKYFTDSKYELFVRVKLVDGIMSLQRWTKHLFIWLTPAIFIPNP
jgi:hypothetical protein